MVSDAFAKGVMTPLRESRLLLNDTPLWCSRRLLLESDTPEGVIFPHVTPVRSVDDTLLWCLKTYWVSDTLEEKPCRGVMTPSNGVWHSYPQCRDSTMILSLVSDTFIRSATFLNDTRQGCHDTVYWSATLLYTESRLHVSELRYTALWSLVCNCDTLFRPQRWQWHQIMETKPMIAWLTKYIYHIHTQANTNKIN